MEIRVEKGSFGVRLSVVGAITSSADAMQFKEALSKGVFDADGSAIEVVVHDSPTLPSSIIGTILRNIEIDKVPLTLIAKTDALYRSLEKLCLVDVLHVRR